MGILKHRQSSRMSFTISSGCSTYDPNPRLCAQAIEIQIISTHCKGKELVVLATTYKCAIPPFKPLQASM